MNESPVDVSKYHAMITPSVKYSSMQCSARLTPNQVQAFIVSKLIKSRRRSLGAQEGTKVCTFYKKVVLLHVSSRTAGAFYRDFLVKVVWAGT